MFMGGPGRQRPARRSRMSVVAALPRAPAYVRAYAVLPRPRASTAEVRAALRSCARALRRRRGDRGSGGGGARWRRRWLARTVRRRPRSLRHTAPRRSECRAPAGALASGSCAPLPGEAPPNENRLAGVTLTGGLPADPGACCQNPKSDAIFHGARGAKGDMATSWFAKMWCW
jgi:hypothetical protein